jgi:hypothetical protein
MAAKSICKIPECDKPVHGHGWCNTHYRRWKNHGDPNSTLRKLSPNGDALKFVNEVALPFDGDECLEWTINDRGNGYGYVCINRKMIGVNRYICQLVYGEPPTKKHHAAHNCGNPNCVNPSHLRWATCSENMADKLLHGTEQRGERHGMAKLTAENVLAIRKLEGTATQSEIGAMFGITNVTVCAIMKRRIWRWL